MNTNMSETNCKQIDKIVLNDCLDQQNALAYAFTFRIMYSFKLFRRESL